MGLNKQKGNMYPWVTHTINFIKGECPHKCEYCFMKSLPVGELRFDTKEFKTNLGENNIIFVGSSVDHFADIISSDWIVKFLDYCKQFDNKYLFQSKNTKNMNIHWWHFPKNSIIGTTIESNKNYNLCRCPTVFDRAIWLGRMYDRGFDTMVSVEPIMDFDVGSLADLIWRCHPSFVSIGADSKNNGLPEPSKDKVIALKNIILNWGIDVKIKDNLRRIIN